MGKHAYLIISHNKWHQLQFLINILNDPRNDFYLLIDSKAKHFDKEVFLQKCSTCHLSFINPMKIYWGDYSQILGEMALLKAATKVGKYDYYHLISATDMPLCTQDQIHDFFDRNQGYEFVDFDNIDDISWAESRTRYYYYFQRQIGRRRKHFLRVIQILIIYIEKLFGVNRTKEIKEYLGKGANWFSITDDFARYIVDNEQLVDRYFRHTYCADEVFLQTLLKMSPFSTNWFGYKNKGVVFQNLRYCDWGRGAPYTFNKKEYFELCSNNTKYLFARKFSDDIVSEDVKKYLCHGT